MKKGGGRAVGHWKHEEIHPKPNIYDQSIVSILQMEVYSELGATLLSGRGSYAQYRA